MIDCGRNINVPVGSLKELIEQFHRIPYQVCSTILLFSYISYHHKYHKPHCRSGQFTIHRKFHVYYKDNNAASVLILTLGVSPAD